MGESEDEGSFCEELGFCIIGMYTLLATHLAKENPLTRTHP